MTWQSPPRSALEALADLDTTTYANAAQERDHRALVLGAVQESVAAHERHLVGSAEEQVGRITQVIKSARDLTGQGDVLEARLRRGDITPVEAFEELRQLELAAKPLIDTATTLPGPVTRLIAKLEDPLTSLDALQQKFSGLKAHYAAGGGR